MSFDADLGNGVGLRVCRSDLGLDYPVYKASFGLRAAFESEERLVKIPVDIIGFNAKPDGWVALELKEGSELFALAAVGDLLAVRRTREPRNGQIAIIKYEERAVVKRVFFDGEGLILRDLDRREDLLMKPSAVEVRGAIEGLTLEGCWYKLITSERLPDR